MPHYCYLLIVSAIHICILVNVKITSCIIINSCKKRLGHFILKQQTSIAIVLMIFEKVVFKLICVGGYQIAMKKLNRKYWFVRSSRKPLH